MEVSISADKMLFLVFLCFSKDNCVTNTTVRLVRRDLSGDHG